MDPNKGKIDIKYFDGEKDKSLNHRSVRPYEALVMDEVVSVQVKGKYYQGEYSYIATQTDTRSFLVLTLYF